MRTVFTVWAVGKRKEWDKGTYESEQEALNVKAREERKGKWEEVKVEADVIEMTEEETKAAIAAFLSRP